MSDTSVYSTIQNHFTQSWNRLCLYNHFKLTSTGKAGHGPTIFPHFILAAKQQVNRNWLRWENSQSDLVTDCYQSPEAVLTYSVLQPCATLSHLQSPALILTLEFARQHTKTSHKTTAITKAGSGPATETVIWRGKKPRVRLLRKQQDFTST